MQQAEEHQHQPASRRAVYALVGLSAIACMGAAAMMTSPPAAPVSLASGKGLSESMSSQLRKTSNMVDGFSPVPAESADRSTTSVSAKTTTSLGLHGMSQAQFETKVERAVTSKVAQALLKTMKPLKRVLKEQQDKIAYLEHRHAHEKKDEKRIATRLSSDLKTGLLSHLKQDVDTEVKNTLTPGVLLRAEKAKKALKRLKLANGNSIIAHHNAHHNHQPHAAAAAASSSSPPSPRHETSAAASESGADAAHGSKPSSASSHEAAMPESAAGAATARGRLHAAAGKAKGAKKRMSEEDKVEQEIAAAKRGTSSSGSSGGKGGKSKGGCDPVRDLYRHGSVSWC